MIDEFTKDYLHGDLRDVRATMLWKLEGLIEYDARRPLTTTGTNLLGLIKHLTKTEALYFGDVFGRPFPERLPWWGDDDFERFADMWAAADESRDEIVDRYRRVWDHSDATIAALDIDTPGHVPWWPRPDVKLFNVLVHVLTETNRHAGHADILREQPRKPIRLRTDPWPPRAPERPRAQPMRPAPVCNAETNPRSCPRIWSAPTQHQSAGVS
jgi:hypothetical protein